MRTLASACVYFLCSWTLVAATEPALSEIRLGADGSVRGLVVSVNMYDIVLSDRGKVLAIETDVVTGNAGRCELGHDGVRRTGGNAEDPRFAQGKLQRIGTVTVEYNRAGQVESVGSVAFTYEALSNRPGKLVRAGDIFFYWHEAGNKLLGVNDVNMEYDRGYNYVTQISSKLRALGDWFAKYKIRIVLSVPPDTFTF